MSYRETIVLSLGGSLIAPPSGIDSKFLTEFNKFIRQEIAGKKRRFFIVCGGGQTTRQYQKAAAEVMKELADQDKDWLGIHATRLNAHLIRTIFHDIAHPRVIDKYNQKFYVRDEPVVICSGWKPGWSTDYCAVMVAKHHGAKTVINMSNIDKVYDKDPRKHKNARPIDKMSWNHFEKLVGDKWTPGLNAPFDPIATKLAKKLELNVIILNGKKLANVGAAIEGKKFVGTVIAPFKLDASFYDRKYYQGEKRIRAGTLVAKLLPIRSLYRALFIKLLLRPNKVLDVGCGLGYTVNFLRMMGVDAQGLEISQYALDYALKGVRPYLKYGNINSIPHPDNTFDLVTTFGVLEHIHEEDIPQAVKECARVSSKYQLHKIYTTENSWLTVLYGGTDLSQVSVFDRSWWENKWKKLELKVKARQWFKIPLYFDTSYLLEK